MLIEVYDVGASRLKGAFAMLNSKVFFLDRMEEPTRPDFYNQVLEMSKKLRKNSTPSCVSVAVPGPVDGRTLLNVPQLGINEPIDLEEKLSPLGPLYIDNDVTAAAYAELNLGIGIKFNNFYLLSFSTGIGVGIVNNRKPSKGQEIGHWIIDNLNPAECGIGHRGCWAALTSGKGIEDRVKKSTSLNLNCKEILNGLSGEDDVYKNRFIAQIREYNAKGLGMMVESQLVPDVEAISVMGSLGINQFNIIVPTPEEIKKYTGFPVPRIVKTSLGDDIGLLGAFYAAKARLDSKPNILTIQGVHTN